LLIYPALFFRKGVVVGNGKQTSDVMSHFLRRDDPVIGLAAGHRSWSYEPDEPTFTPRISGCALGDSGALSIIKRASDGMALKNYYLFTLAPGKGKLIATYAGPNESPLPSFDSEPLDVLLEAESADAAARHVYDALAPEDPRKDLRVSVVSVFANDATGERQFTIINRSDAAPTS